MIVSIRDDVAILNRGDIVSRGYPFDLRVITTTSISDKNSFGRMVRNEIERQSPNSIVIAVDPVHKYVAIEYGKDSGVSPSNWDTIKKAGNADFKASNWTAGVLKIADSAASFKQLPRTQALVVRQPEPGTTTTTTVVHTTPPVVYQNHSSSSAGWWIFGGIVLIALVVAYIWRRNRKREETQYRLLSELNEEVAEKRALNREVDDWQRRLENSVATTPALSTPTPVVATVSPRRYETVSRSRPTYVEPTPRYVPAPTYVAPVVAPQPVVVNQSSHTDSLLTGMMLNEMMHSHDHHTTRIIERDIVREPNYSSYSNDAGGTVSSWDSESNDAGGTVSTFDDEPSQPVYEAPSTYDSPSYESPSYDPPSFSDDNTNSPDF